VLFCVEKKEKNRRKEREKEPDLHCPKEGERKGRSKLHVFAAQEEKLKKESASPLTKRGKREGRLILCPLKMTEEGSKQKKRIFSLLLGWGGKRMSAFVRTQEKGKRGGEKTLLRAFGRGKRPEKERMATILLNGRMEEKGLLYSHSPEEGKKGKRRGCKDLTEKSLFLITERRGGFLLKFKKERGKFPTKEEKE